MGGDTKAFRKWRNDAGGKQNQLHHWFDHLTTLLPNEERAIRGARKERQSMM